MRLVPMRFPFYLLITTFALAGLTTGGPCSAQNAQEGQNPPSNYQQPGVGQPYSAHTAGPATGPNTLYGGVNTQAPQAPYPVPMVQGGLNQQNYLPGNPMFLPPQMGRMQQTAPYGTPPLQGNVQGNGMTWSPGIPLQPQNAPLGQPDNSAHPNWIPGYAYTNDNMITPYRAGFWMKSPIPSRVSQALLAPSVSRYWHGSVPDPCYVQIVPIPSAPGNFTFQSGQWGAPRGWLQNLQRTDGFGFPLYRYWLDQR